MLTPNPHNEEMQVVIELDPIQAFNARAKAAGWTFACGAAQGFEHKELASALALWRKKAAGRAMPERSDMTARDMKPFLSHMSLIERIGSGKNRRYRVRLHGTALAGYDGDKTGLFLDEIVPAQFVGSYVGVYDAVLELLAPVRVVSQFQAPNIDYLVGESLVVPLTVTGKAAPIILSVTYAEPRGKARKA